MHRLFSHLPINSLYLTPLEETIPYISEKDCTVILGNRDKLFPDITKIRNLPDVRLHVFENAVHSLEIWDDYERSLEILRKVAAIYHAFFK